MTQLNENVEKRFVFAKNGTIFNIADNNNGDYCKFSTELTSGNVPSITVTETKNEGSEVNVSTLYLDALIEVGDSYDGESAFTKSILISGEDCSDISLGEYYTEICRKELSEIIVNQGFTDVDSLISYLSNQRSFPKYMISGKTFDNRRIIYN